MTVDDHIQTISLLSERCKLAFTEESFELGNKLLKERQQHLEQLVEIFNGLPEDDPCHQNIKTFLLSVIADDQKQAANFSQLKKQAFKDSVQQKNTAKAIKNYKNIDFL